jgi:hypothetical protein
MRTIPYDIASPRHSVPLFYDHAWRGIFVDLLVAMDSAPVWLRMSDAELGTELARLYSWIASDANSDRAAIEWICGFVGKPPSVQAVRSALKAIVPVPGTYWSSLAKVKDELERKEPFDYVAAALDEMPDADERW